MKNTPGELWNTFANSGKIKDYLNYRKMVNEVESNSGAEHSGIGHSGEDGTGKRQDNININ